jgi:GrpB-like predicted nucleotidyltransferase (UPF0157 family)
MGARRSGGADHSEPGKINPEIAEKTVRLKGVKHLRPRFQTLHVIQDDRLTDLSLRFWQSAGRRQRTMTSTNRPVTEYRNPGAVCNAYDPRAPEAARLLIRAIVEREPSLTVEHVGSSAVPACDGKGTLDLLVMYEPGGLDRAKTALADLGFQKQTGRDPFPEDRPMRVGSWRYQGMTYPVHAHVIVRSAAEAGEMIRFRDVLRADPDLRAAYIARKREIIRKGVADSIEYSIIKGSFVREVLGEEKDSG